MLFRWAFIITTQKEKGSARSLRAASSSSPSAPAAHPPAAHASNARSILACLPACLPRSFIAPLVRDVDGLQEELDDEVRRLWNRGGVGLPCMGGIGDLKWWGRAAGGHAFNARPPGLDPWFELTAPTSVSLAGRGGGPAAAGAAGAPPGARPRRPGRHRRAVPGPVGGAGAAAAFFRVGARGLLRSAGRLAARARLCRSPPRSVPLQLPSSTRPPATPVLHPLPRQKHFLAGGPLRMRHTLPPLAFAALQAVRQVAAAEKAGSPPKVRARPLQGCWGRAWAHTPLGLPAGWLGTLHACPRSPATHAIASRTPPVPPGGRGAVVPLPARLRQPAGGRAGARRNGAAAVPGLRCLGQQGGGAGGAGV